MIKIGGSNKRLQRNVPEKFGVKVSSKVSSKVPSEGFRSECFQVELHQKVRSNIFQELQFQVKKRLE